MATPDQIAQFKLDNWQHALAVSQATGIDPRIVMAQAGVESDWGNAAPGNNYFGIKGPGQQLDTTEVVNGQSVPTKASFRTYRSPAESFAGYANLPIIQKAGRAGDFNSQVAALSGYATDPAYTSKIRNAALGLTVPEGVRASVLPPVPIVGAPGDNTPSMAMASFDPRTAGDADLAGYGAGAAIPTADPAASTAALASLLSQQHIGAINNVAQGLLAQGAPQSIVPPLGVPMLQAHRGEPIPLPDLVPRRGLLG